MIFDILWWFCYAIVFNILVYWVLTRNRTVRKYTSPIDEFHIPLVKGWISMLFMGIIDLYHIRGPHRILTGSFSVDSIHTTYSIYYDIVTERFSLAVGRVSNKYLNVSYDEAVTHIEFWYKDNPPVRHRYLRLIRLLYRYQECNFNNNILKQEALNSTTPIS